jgi:hypothetical protein
MKKWRLSRRTACAAVVIVAIVGEGLSFGPKPEPGMRDANFDRLSRLDSLLVSADFEGAQSLIDTVRHQPRATDAKTMQLKEYEDFLLQIGRVEQAADSVVEKLAGNAGLFRQKFDELDGGNVAHVLYLGFEEEINRGAVRSAYVRYLTADFFRLNYVERERHRLQMNLRLAKDFVEAANYSAFDSMLTRFEVEPPGAAFRQLKPTLEQQYDQLNETVATSRRIIAYEESRSSVPARVYLSVGVGLNPNVALRNNQVVLSLPGVFTRGIVDENGYAVRSVTFGLSAHAGYAVMPQMVIGLTYFYSKLHFGGTGLLWPGAGSVPGPGRHPWRYDGDIEYFSTALTIRYLLDTRDGFRPFGEGGIGYVRSRLIPQPDLGEPNRLVADPIDEKGMLLTLGFGSEFIPAADWPLVLTGFGRGGVPLGSSEILNRVFFEIGVRAGFFIRGK